MAYSFAFGGFLNNFDGNKIENWNACYSMRKFFVYFHGQI